MTNPLLRSLSVLALATFGVCAPSFAQTTYKAHIPFPFEMGKTPQAAGDYLVRTNPNWTVMLTNLDTNHTAFVMSTPADFSSALVSQSLLFQREGTTYHLAKIRKYGSEVRIPVPHAPKNQEAAKPSSGVIVAEVTVPLK